jgi:hypothetical protein
MVRTPALGTVHARRGQPDRTSGFAMVDRWDKFTHRERTTILIALTAAPVRKHDDGETEELTEEILNTLG